MMRKKELTIIKTCSTIFQKPTEKPPRFEAPRRGYHGKAGFVAVKAGKKLYPTHVPSGLLRAFISSLICPGIGQSKRLIKK